MPERHKVLIKALCITVEDRHSVKQGQEGELMALLLQKDLKVKDSSKATRYCVKPKKGSPCSGICSFTAMKKNLLLDLSFPSRRRFLDLYSRPQDCTVFEVSCHEHSPSRQDLDGCDSFLHLSKQLLNPHVTPGINMHYHLGQTHITHCSLKNRPKIYVKELLCKGEHKSSKEQFLEVKSAVSIHQCDPGRVCARASL